LEFRDRLESLSAYYAALRSTEADKARLDAEFHMIIAESVHNVVLLHTLRNFFSILASSISDNLKNLFKNTKARKLIMNHHKAMYDAIIAGNAEEARTAAHAHLVFVEDNLLKMRQEETRIQRSLRRTENLNSSR